MQARGFLNYRLEYSWPIVIYCVCQPNELKREIKKQSGGASKNLGAMAHSGAPLESPLCNNAGRTLKWTVFCDGSQNVCEAPLCLNTECTWRLFCGAPRLHENRKTKVSKWIVAEFNAELWYKETSKTSELATKLCFRELWLASMQLLRSATE